MEKEPIKSIDKKEWRIPFESRVMRVIRAFTLTEKTIFVFFTGLFILSSLSLLYQVNKLFLVDVPDYGGTLTEGIIGSPRFINPLLAVSEVDKDLTSLIYSGLLKINPEGKLTADLAESYTISPDGLNYTFILKDNLYFQDGVRLTTDEIVFTVEKAQDSSLKSPREANWSGVLVHKVSDKEITFVLKQPYSPFIQNATLGILPKHLWKDASTEEFPFSQFNIKPVGSGPYKVDSIVYASSGLPGEYRLKSFNKYALGEAFITNLVIKTYQNEKGVVEAYNGGEIGSFHSVSQKQLPDIEARGGNVVLSPLPRIFGVFFNQNLAPVLVYKEVREALDMATDKQIIVDNILGGFGQVINSPVPLKTVAPKLDDVISAETRLENAKNILVAKGWKQNADGIFEKKEKNSTTKLEFSISTGNAPELKETAILLQQQWEKLGAKVDVKIFEIGDLNQNVIKPRKYDALLFGEIIGRDLDLYPFWHSSQRTSPGLNIAIYTNLKADKILEKIRTTTSSDEQEKGLEDFNKEIRSDIPAIFTYSPYFIYIIPKQVQNVQLGALAGSSERFSDINKWFIETNSIWNFFKTN